MSTQPRRSLRLRSSNHNEEPLDPDKPQEISATSNHRSFLMSKPVEKKKTSKKHVTNDVPDETEANENIDALEKKSITEKTTKTRSPRKRGVSLVEKKDDSDEDKSIKNEIVPAKTRRIDSKTREKNTDMKEDKKKIDKSTVVQSIGRPRRGCVKKITVEKYDHLMSGSSSSSDVTSSESENDDSDLELEIGKAKKRRETMKGGKRMNKEDYTHESSTDSMSEEEEEEKEEDEEEEEEELVSDQEDAKRGGSRSRATASTSNGRFNRKGMGNGKNKKNTVQRRKMEMNQLPVKIINDKEYDVDYDEMVAWEAKSIKMVRDLRELERDRANGGQIMDTVNEFIERCLKDGRMIEMDEKESIRVTHIHENELMEMNRKKKLTVAQRIKEQVQNEKKKLEEERKEESEDDEEEDEWEEMELADNEDKKETTMEVRMDTKKKLNAPWKAKWIRQEVNREVRQRCENIHKAHLLSYVSHLRHLMTIATSSTRKDDGIPLSVRVLSIIPSSILNGMKSTVDGKKTTNEKMIEEICEWWKKTFKIIDMKRKKNLNGLNEIGRLDELMEVMCYETSKDAAILFTSFASYLNISIRIVARCQVVTKKPKENIPASKKESKNKIDKKTERSSLSEEDSMSYWCELWSEEKKMWKVFDPFINSAEERKEIKKGKNKKEKKDEDIINDFVKSWNTSTHIEEFRSCMEKDGPVLYFIAVDNCFGIRDVSWRYINGKDLISRELKARRANEEWIMELWQNKVWAMNEDKTKKEDEEWMDKLKKMDMPKTVAAFKDHPLYVLDKDVLKMQIIFPFNTQSIGEVSKYKIYLREFVRPINTAKWYEKMGRQIKKDEYPCGEKKVTNPMSGETGTQGLYGYWQTEKWDGGDIIECRIPRNEFGNVYLYQPEMIPRGCIYLVPDGIQRVAIELGKDFVPAVIAWYYKGGNTIPLIRGAAYIKEDVPELLTAWKVSYKRWKEEEKKERTDRCMNRWKKLIKGMIRLAAMRKEFAPLDNKKKDGTTLDEEAVEQEEKASWPQKKYGGEMFE